MKESCESLDGRTAKEGDGNSKGETDERKHGHCSQTDSVFVNDDVIAELRGRSLADIVAQAASKKERPGKSKERVDKRKLPENVIKPCVLNIDTKPDQSQAWEGKDGVRTVGLNSAGLYRSTLPSSSAKRFLQSAEGRRPRRKLRS